MFKMLEILNEQQHLQNYWEYENITGANFLTWNINEYTFQLLQANGSELKSPISRNRRSRNSIWTSYWNCDRNKTKFLQIHN